MTNNIWESRVRRITLEGPDLAGKSTLYKSLHNSTGYIWDIQDRSSLSMIVYSRFYGRDETPHREQLSRDLLDIGNLVVVVIPSAEELSRRYKMRGDELQNLASVLKIRQLFLEETKFIQGYPNTLVIQDDMDAYTLASNVESWIQSRSLTGMKEIADNIAQIARAQGGEASGVTLSIDCGSAYLHPDEEVLQWPQEREYYSEIVQGVCSKISREIAGDNEYFAKQNPHTTRRFVWSSDTCISMLNFFVRGDTHTLYATLRSSETERTLPYDLRFLSHLMNEAEHAMGVSHLSRRIHLIIHSAHIVRRKENA